jgi:hypothetical protein
MRAADVIDVEHVVIVQIPNGPHLGFVEINGTTASKLTTLATGGQTCRGPLLSHPTFEKCERRENTEDRTPSTAIRRSALVTSCLHESQKEECSFKRFRQITA